MRLWWKITAKKSCKKAFCLLFIVIVYNIQYTSINICTYEYSLESCVQARLPVLSIWTFTAYVSAYILCSWLHDAWKGLLCNCH